MVVSVNRYAISSSIFLSTTNRALIHDVGVIISLYYRVRGEIKNGNHQCSEHDKYDRFHERKAFAPHQYASTSPEMACIVMVLGEPPDLSTR
jgi:hypothetical protein